MKRLRKVFVCAAAVLLCAVAAHAESPEEFFNRINREYDEFAQRIQKDFDSFRDKCNREYAEFMKQPWKPVTPIAPERRPTRPGPTPQPDVIVNNDQSPTVIPAPIRFIDSLSKPVPEPHPMPIEPVKPAKPDTNSQQIEINFYGAPVKLSKPELSNYSLCGNRTSDIADGWNQLSMAETDPLLYDLLSARESLALPDWHYLLLIDKAASILTPRNHNEQTLLTGFLLNQSGFDIRFAMSTTDGRLHLLFNSSSTFYNRARYRLNNGNYYALSEPRGAVSVCDFNTPGETKLTVAVDRVPNLPYSPGNKREITLPGGKSLSVAVNRNLIDLMADYPDAALRAGAESRWLAYALMPTSDEIRREAYPILRNLVSGMNQYDAVNTLLKVAQQFPYGYDSEIWGRERVFFMEESWHYPYSDCEDHAINFAHMVRDLLGLKVCLVSYPNHLSASVAITDGSARGSIYRHGGQDYMSCDATYFGAPAGSIMPQFKSTAATLIPLK